ncbi:molybdenum cofactor biosynthesis protein MoaE [Litoribrevibacter albus]|uniref:Molybdopterin synthase catalytic subunit n=1 Tax=Litoribrevibacter albus TaxID=1473156 RepID=A0AA37W433_9GAMM|nr:molybdenum cofactor biosynthesis protein MoaE [Litoribrevibacter albus]GLQ29742.1 molybdopterin synthase catalytic subunit [Litoribrevibacter albus]
MSGSAKSHACKIEISVQEADFDLGALSNQWTDGDVENGAQVMFVGRVREFAQANQQSMTLEHYPGMTEKALRETADIAAERWRINKALIIHRIGELQPADQIVLVMVLSGHREDAFNAAWFIMDHLKTTAPFWKKESADGEGHWVDAKESDDNALTKWDNGSDS